MIEGAEFFVIFLVALVVLGPQRLPEMARKVGGWTAELRKAARELREGLESEVGDVREIARDIREPMREVQDTMRDTRKVFDQEVKPAPWVGPKPLSGPTPEDAMRDLERINETGGAIDEPGAGSDQPETTAPEPTEPAPKDPEPIGTQATESEHRDGEDGAA